MKKKILADLAVAAAILFILSARIYAYDDHDFQVWNTEAEEFKVGEDAKIAFEQEFRWADNAEEFYYQHYDVGFFYNLKKYLSVGGGYRQIYELKQGKFMPENAPYATLTLFWDLKNFKFEDRSRMEYRHFDYQADGARYRNKFSVRFPWKFTKLEIQPYVSDEILVIFGTTNQFNQNRFSSGVGMSLFKNIKAEIYYMLMTSRSGIIWKDTNVLGTKVKISF
jgi:hypothetical protein